MRRSLVITGMLLLFILMLPQGALGAAGPVWTSKTAVNGRSVTMINVNLNDPRVTIIPALANGRTGQTAELAAIARACGAAAAINGTFFNAYSKTDNTSWGTIAANGVFYRTGNGGGALIIGPDKQVKAVRLRVKITGTIDGPSKQNLQPWDRYLCNWYAWDVNRNYNSPQAIVVFTPAFGQIMQVPTATTVTVRNGQVASIQSGPTPIPSDGYVIGFGPAAQNIASRFSVGDTVTLKYELTDENGNPVDFNGGHIIQAGPLLVKKGKNALNLAVDSVKEAKFFGKCSWSFAGIKRDGATFVMGAVSGVNVYEMAAVVSKLGMQDAIMLDGNASCGLYYQGKYLIKPGRKISNALVVSVRP